MTGYQCQPAATPSDGSTCTEQCGDGVNWAEGTSCDDGNKRNGDGCSSTCSIETGFECDFTTYETADVCYEICGDGLDYGKYACDDGNTAEYDGCNTDCEILEGWYCYGGTKTSPDTCDEICGDGINYGSFDNECDDGNTDDNDGCSSDCTVESGYECSNGDRGYEFSDSCNEICGDGIRITSTIECDDGNTADGDGCDSSCYIEIGFTCYDGSADHEDICYEVCGDGLRFTSSSITTFCDDANNDDDDGCDSDCTVEDGWYCYGGSST